MYQIGSLVEMKKPHACTIKATGKKANEWEVTRLGADIKICCTKTARISVPFFIDCDMLARCAN